eukprot:100956_1
MGNTAQKQKKNAKFNVNRFKKTKIKSQPLTKETICLIVSYWVRVCTLSEISYQHITSNVIINNIYDYSQPVYFMEIAQRILSIAHFTPKQVETYKDNKAQNMQSFIAAPDILRLCDDIETVLSKEDTLLRLNTNKNTNQNVIIFGDIRGDLFSLLHHFNSIRKEQAMDIISKIQKHNDIYLFLASYVCRGKYSIECICLLYCLKLMFPTNIYLLRGNKEDPSINRIYGFYDELKKCYPKQQGGSQPKTSKTCGIRLWKRMNETFRWMSLCAVINDKWFAVHGGLSPELPDINVLNTDVYCKPLDVGDTGVVCDLLWCDPEQIEGWGEQDKGVSYTFGPDVIEKWLQNNKLEMIIRAHQIVEDGFEWFAGRQLLILFSSVDFMNEFDNDGAIMIVDSDMQFYFNVLKSTKRKK